MKTRRLLRVVVLLVVVVLAGGGGRTSATSAQGGCVEEDKYTENFDTGWASGWYLGSGFQIVTAGSGKVLQGAGASSAIATYLFGDYWADFSLSFKMTLNAGELLASLRYNSNSADLIYDRIKGKATDRYYVKFTSTSVVVVRTKAGTDSTMSSAATSFAPSQAYAIKLVVAGGAVSVYVNDTLVLTATDSSPVPSGSIALETKSNAQVTVDDVQVVATVPCEHTWAQTASVPVGRDINVIAVDPKDANVVYTGTEHMGIWKSTDGGLTWTEVGYAGDMSRLGKTSAIAIAPSNTAVVYASFATEVDKSIDGGLHWTRTGLMDAGAVVRGLAVSPRDTNVVYAALGGGSPTAVGGIFKSSDGGANWARVGSLTYALSIAISASTPETMYAGATDGIYKSTDGGTTWTQVYSGVSSSLATPFSMAIDPTDSNTVYAVLGGTLRSTNGGSSWTKVRTDGAQVVLAPSQPTVLYLMAGPGILKSTNRGDTWSTATTATVAASSPQTIAVDPSNASKIYIGTRGQGIYFWQDGGGMTLSSPAVRSIPASLGAAIAADPINDSTVYVGTEFGEIYVSDDKGGSWTRLTILGTGSSTSLITGLVVDPLNPDVIYASNVEGVYKSQDGGANWKTITSGLSDPRVISLAIDPKNPNRLFAGTGSSRPRNMTEGSGMFYSANGGESWSKVQGIPDVPIPAIAISPSESNTIYAAAMAAGIYRSTTGGTSWSQVNTGLQDLCVYTLAINPQTPSVAYAGTTGNSTYCTTFSGKPDHVYKTVNGGTDWKIALEGKSIYDTIEGIAVDPSNPDNVYVANHTEKVWFSADAGATWKRADKGVIRHGAHLYLWAIAFNASGSTVYMTSCGRGVLRNNLTTAESCATSLAPTSETFEVAGGNGSVSVVAASSCSWTATSNASWITVTSSGSGGSGNGSVTYAVSANTGASRSGTITIAGRTFTVAQRGFSVGVDLNGDGRGDVFRYNPVTGAWGKEVGSGNGWFSGSIGTWDVGWSVYAADFNLDTLADLFLYNLTTGAWVKAYGSVAGGYTYPASGMWSRGWNVYVFDLDGDGRSDVGLYNPTTGIWFKCLHDPTTGAFSRYYAGAWSPQWNLYPADWNGDGKGDFFLYNLTTGQWFRATNDGGAGYSYVSESWSGGWGIYPGDFSGDGKSDIFLYNDTTGQYFICINTGVTFVYPGSGFWAPAWTVNIADFDGNGKADVHLYHATTGEWFECVTTSAYSFAYYTSAIRWDRNWQVFITDLTGDGKSDVLLYSGRTWVQALNTSLGAWAYGTGTWDTGLTIVANSTRVP